jgi:hypothetical protein
MPRKVGLFIFFFSQKESNGDGKIIGGVAIKAHGQCHIKRKASYMGPAWMKYYYLVKTQIGIDKLVLQWVHFLKACISIYSCENFL